ncbi:NAD(P)/FAD-dependent oxidoreductase [Phaeovulum sp. W22_SRMD_FR3]|uniref:NAD(P)/FAD-dependent oxidoreductase n=1 Tax=Phaeovulum sp. W22_SRMD_FR3 TaxID=3240274 RepID=UPI003F944D7F
MQNDPRSHGLWERTAPAAPQSGPLTGDMSADVVVIGAGYTGLSTALHLAERGKSVVLLEAVEVGFGGAGRNVGLVNAGMWVMPEALCETLGPVAGNRLIDFLGDGPRQVFEVIDRHAIACEAEWQGTLHLAVGEKGLAEIRERARQWQSRGAPVEVLDAAETARRVGSTAYAGALLDRRAGTIQPLAYARGLAAAGVQQGVSLFTQSPVTALRRSGAGWQAVTPKGSVTAQWVVIGTDAYTGHIFPQIRQEQVFLPYFNLATTPLNAEMQARILPERQGAWDTKEILSSFRFDQAGRLVFGSVGALRRGGAAVHRAWARREMARLWPDLGPVRFEAEWYGQIGMTADNLPRCHQLDEKIITICGYNGRGIAPGTAFGRFLAGHVAGETEEADLPLAPTPAQPISARPLREAYYEFGAQVAHFTGSRF